MRTATLWPSVEIPIRGHETCEGCADVGAGGACGRQRSGLRWGSLWGHEACEGCAEVGAGGRTRTAAFWPSVELPMGARNV
eukprot:1831168-Pyramimonas_sp.AAC.1